jgi:hypothetical protein
MHLTRRRPRDRQVAVGHSRFKIRRRLEITETSDSKEDLVVREELRAAFEFHINVIFAVSILTYEKSSGGEFHAS